MHRSRLLLSVVALTVLERHVDHPDESLRPGAGAIGGTSFADSSMCRCGIPSGSDGTSSGGFHPVVVSLDVVASRRQSVRLAPFRSIGSSKRTRFPTGEIARSTGSRSDVEGLDEDDETDCVEREQSDDSDGHPLSSPREGVQGVASRNGGGSAIERPGPRGEVWSGRGISPISPGSGCAHRL